MFSLISVRVSRDRPVVAQMDSSILLVVLGMERLNQHCEPQGVQGHRSVILFLIHLSSHDLFCLSCLWTYDGSPFQHHAGCSLDVLPSMISQRKKRFATSSPCMAVTTCPCPMRYDSLGVCMNVYNIRQSQTRDHWSFRNKRNAFGTPTHLS